MNPAPSLRILPLLLSFRATRCIVSDPRKGYGALIYRTVMPTENGMLSHERDDSDYL